MGTGITILVVMCSVILGQLFLQASDRKKNHNEVIEKLNLIIEKLNQS